MKLKSIFALNQYPDTNEYKTTLRILQDRITRIDKNLL